MTMEQWAVYQIPTRAPPPLQTHYLSFRPQTTTIPRQAKSLYASPRMPSARPPAPVSLSLAQARKLILHSQGLLRAASDGPALAATHRLIEHLGYVQIDSISVIQRAHHHTLWNRQPRYQPAHLDDLMRAGQVFEYWSHAAAYLPMRDYRFSLPNKRAIAGGRRLWFQCEAQCKQRVLARLRAEGPLQARDFVEAKPARRLGVWEWRPTKYALEQLFMEGTIMVVRRANFHKVYDLTERVLPADTDCRPPNHTDYCQHLITTYLRANGLGHAAHIAYLRPGLKPAIAAELTRMTAAHQLVAVTVNGSGSGTKTGANTGADYYARPQAFALLDRPLARARLQLLSPFDNLLIQRPRMVDLFAYDYQLECYTPPAKRKFGYFCLPILWQGVLLGRLDCKAERTTQTLIIKHLSTTDTPPIPRAEFCHALYRALQPFMAFNHCTHLHLAPTIPPPFRQLLQAELAHAPAPAHAI